MRFLSGAGAGAAVVLGLGLGSCGGGDGGGMTDPGSQAAEIRVTVSRDGSPAGGVVVRLFTAGGATAQATQTTGSGGTTTFGSLAAGAYEVEVEVPEGAELSDGAPRRPVTAAAGSTATVAFALTTSGSGGAVQVVAGANLAFNPPEVTVSPGTTVEWRNEAAIIHTITPQGHTEWSEGSVTGAGDVFSHTFQTVGSFPYECVVHVGMNGVVEVQ
jgi:plastocyanin